jgi:hypothetical protein
MISHDPRFDDVKPILEHGLEKHLFAEGQYGNSYCGACNKAHAKKWFTSFDKTTTFYLCLISKPTFVIGRNGKYQYYTVAEFEQEIESWHEQWSWFNLLKPESVEVALSPMPPFVHVSIVWKWPIRK